MRHCRAAHWTTHRTTHRRANFHVLCPLGPLSCPFVRVEIHRPQPVQLTFADGLSPPASDRRPTEQRRTYTVEEAAQILGISRSHAYECVRSGDIPSLRLRRRIVVPAHALDALARTGGCGDRSV